MKSSQQITDIAGLQKLGTILTVWAHPDDETFCAGGLLAAAVANGQKVICVTATHGDQGVQDPQKWPVDRLAEIRGAELAEALKILGIKHHHWLSYGDGLCQAVDLEEGASQVAHFIAKYQPDTIITFGPEGLTGHTDHQAVSHWVDQAIERSGREIQLFHPVLTVEQYKGYLESVDAKLNIFYNIEYPPLLRSEECDICLTCDEHFCRCKQDAFAAMPSQYTKMRQSFEDSYLKEAFRVEAFIKG